MALMRDKHWGALRGRVLSGQSLRKLTLETEREIYEAYVSGVSRVSLAKTYGVSRQTIYGAINRYKAVRLRALRSHLRVGPSAMERARACGAGPMRFSQSYLFTGSIGRKHGGQRDHLRGRHRTRVAVSIPRLGRANLLRFLGATG